MGKESKNPSFYKRKILRIERKDGETRYRVNFPKNLVESCKEGQVLYGFFKLDIMNNEIIFYKSDRLDILERMKKP